MRFGVVGTAVALGCACSGGGGGGDGLPGSFDAAAFDAAGSDAARSDSGAPLDASAACQPTAPPGPRAGFTVPTATENQFDLYVVGLGDGLPTCPIRVNTTPLVSTGAASGGFAWSPDGLTLAYEGETGMAVVDMSGAVPGVPFVIDQVGLDAWQPEWSPDSRWLAYFTDGSARDLWVAEVEGGIPAAPIRLNDSGGGRVTTFQWHPFSAGLLFHREGVTSGTDLFWYPLPPTPGTRQALDAPSAQFATFSPAGDRIAYVDGPGNFPDELWVRRLVDGVARAPVNVSTDESGRSASIYWWSPDGERILYCGNFLRNLYLTGVRATDPDPVAVYEGSLTYTRAASWLDDGRISLHADDAVYAADVDGLDAGPLENLTPDITIDERDVAPDGRSLAFVSPLGTGDETPYVVSLESGGGAPRPVGPEGADAAMWFLPSGQRLLSMVRGGWPGERLYVADPAASAPEPFLLFESEEVGGLPPWWYSHSDPPASLDDRLLFRDVPTATLLHADLAGQPPYAVEPVLDDAVQFDAIHNLAWAPSPP